MTDVANATPLPPTAMARLAGAGTGLFTAGLSVNEFALLRDCGLAPLGVVIGTSMYHVGLEAQRWNHSVELGMLTHAVAYARDLAYDRMEAEAAALGADGVVGVHLPTIRHEGAADVLEFLAVGTAVRAVAAGKSASASAKADSWLTAAGRPFTTDLSGQDLWTLIRTGHRPVAVVRGVCVYHVAHQTMRQAMTAFGQSVELPQYSQALYDARELAITRMQANAAGVGAEGVLGVRVETSAQVWRHHAIEFLAIGSAIRASTAGAGSQALGAPSPVLPLTP